MEALRKQLELKAVEIVDLLETLDTDQDVPELMQRRRGQDNFDQRKNDLFIQHTHNNVHLYSI
jgi:hypothetical protein